MNAAPAPDISKEDIRHALLVRAKAYAMRRDCALSRIGEEAIRDSKFLARVEAGGNFTIETYQRVIDWLDAAERAAPAAGVES